MGTLANEEIGNASGLYNLMRNVGGSIGIAVVNTMLVRHEQVHRNYLVYSMAGASHTFQQQYQAFAGFLTQHADVATAGLQAYKMLERSLISKLLCCRTWTIFVILRSCASSARRSRLP